MIVSIYARLQRVIKKLDKSEKKALEGSILLITAKPKIGFLKTGDLAGTRVYKYSFYHKLILLAYVLSLDEKHLVLIGYGCHENSYRDLKRL